MSLRRWLRSFAQPTRLTLRRQARPAALELLEDRYAPAIWTGAAADNDWNNPSNWDISDVPDVAGETADFDGSVAGTAITINSAVAPDSVTFSGAANGFTIGGASLTLATGLSHPASGSNIVNSNVLGAGSTQVNSGVLTLGGTGNAYSGGTTVTSGTLRLGAANVIPNTGTVTVDNILDLAGVSESIDALNGTGIITSNVAGTPTLTVGVSGGTGNFGGDIQNGLATVSLTKAGAGTQTLSGANNNTYTGLTTASAGTLILAKSSGVNAIGGNLTLSGGNVTITGGRNNQTPATTAVTITAGTFAQGATTQTYASISQSGGTFATNSAGVAANITVTGATTLSAAATFQINSSAAGATFSTNSLSISGTTLGNVIIGNSATTGTHSIIVGAGGLTMSSGNLRVGNATTAGQLATAQLVLNGNVFVLGGATNVIDTTNTTGTVRVDLSGTTRTIDVVTGATLTVSIPMIGTAGFTKANLGELTLSGNSTYTGITTVNRGTLTVNNANALGASGAGNQTVVNGNDGATITTVLRFNPTAPISVPESLFLASNATGRVTLRNSAQANTLTGPIDVSSTGNLVQVPSDGTGSLTFTGDITGTMSGGSLFFLRGASTSANNRVLGNLTLTGSNLAKTDAGLWVVGAAGKTYSWVNTQVAVGTLRMGTANVLPAAGTITLGQNDTNSATLDLAGFSQTTAGLTYNYAGTAVTSVGSVTTGAGTLTLNGNLTYNTTNGYTGTGGVLSGNLNLGGGTRTFTVNDSTAVTSVVELTVSAAVSNGALAKAGAGLLSLTGTNSYAGGSTVTAGTLRVNGSVASGVTVTAPGTLDGIGTINGTVTGTGTVTAGNSPGTLTINGNFTPTGTVAFEVNPPANGPGVNYDQIVVNGLLNLTGAALSFSGTVGAVAGTQFVTLIANDLADVTGAATNFANGATVTINGNNYTIFYAAGDGNDVMLAESSVPTSYFVDDAWVGFAANTAIADVDLGTTGAQPGVFGINAFATIGSALGAATATATIVVNGGTYAESVSLAGTQTLRITGPNAAQTVVVNALTTVAGQTIQIDGTSTLTVGDATSTTIAGNLNGTGTFTKAGAGTIVLSSATSALTGPVVVNGGVLSLTNIAATGATSLVTVNAGTLELNAIATYARPLQLNNGATLRAVGSSTYSASGNPVIASGATVNFATVNAADVLAIGSGYTNAAGSTVTPTINITGPGMVALNSSSAAFRGLWVVQAGTLRLGANAGALGTATAALPLVGSSLTFAGGNVLVRSDTAIAYAVPVIVNASGTLSSQRTVAGAALAHSFSTLTIGAFTLTTTYDNATVTSGDAAFDFTGLTTLTGNATINTNRPGTARTLPRFNGGMTDGGVARTLTFNNTSASATEEAAVIAAPRTFLATTQIDLTGTQAFRLVLQNASGTDNARVRFANSTGTATILDVRSDVAGATFANNLILDASGRLRQSHNVAAAGMTFNVGSITYNGAFTLVTDATGNVNANTPYQFNVPSITLNGNGTLNIANNGSGVGTVNVAGTIGEVAGPRNFTKAGAGTLVLNSAAAYTGTTAINNGTVIANVDNTLSPGPLTMGTVNVLSPATPSTVAALDLTLSNQTVASLTVVSNSASNNTITIGAGKTLSVNATTANSVVVGVDPPDNTTNSVTNLVVSGAGSMSVTNTTGSMLIGVPTNPTSDNTSSSGNLDLRNLTGGFTYNASGTGRILIGTDTGGGSTAGTPVGNFLRLSDTTNTITAAGIDIGNNIHAQNNTLQFGTGVNNINASVINVAGVSGFARRGSGTIGFNAPGGVGVTTIRNQAGTGPADLNIGVNSSNTGAAMTGTVDLTGHTIDAQFGTVQLGVNAGASTANGPSTYTNTLSFDTGTMSIATLLRIGRKTSTSSNNLQTNFVNIAGGTVTVASIDMAAHTSTAGTVQGTLNISGGSTTVSGGITLGSASAAGGTAVGTVNLTGGTLTVAGNIAQGAAVGTVTTTFNFNGGTLQAGANNATWMQGLTAANVLPGNAIVDTNGFNTTIAQALLDSGGGLIKNAAGALTLTNPGNAYSGDTTLNGGVLKVGANEVIPHGAGKGNVIVNAATLDVNGFSETINGLTGIAAAVVDNTAVGAGTLTFGANDQTATYAGVMQDTGGALSLVKTGTGVETLSGVAPNTYQGTMTVSAGTLLVTGGDNLSDLSAGTTVGFAGTLSLGANEATQTLALETGTTDGADVLLAANALTLLGDVSVVVNGTGAVGAAITGVALSSLNLNGAAPRTFTVANGAAADDVTITTDVTNGAVTKSGPGTMTYAGAQANTYMGATVVTDGVLSLDKDDGITSIAGPGGVSIGDGVGGSASAVVRVDSDEQIVNTVLITLGGADGQFFVTFDDTETILPLTANFAGGDVRVAGELITTANYVQGPGVAGTTTLAGGTIRVITGLGNYDLNNGTLQGTGTVIVTKVNAFGTIDPGIGATSAGQINIQGNLDIKSSGIVNLNVGGTSLPNFDQISVTLNSGITPAPINVTNGTVWFRGTLNTGAIDADGVAPFDYTPTNLDFYDVMTFETRMLDDLALNHLRLPSDFATKNLGPDLVGFRYDARFLSATNQLNAESYNSTTFGTLGAPPPSVGLAKKLRLTALNSIASDVTGATTLTKGGFTSNSTIRHMYQYVTVKNITGAAIDGPIYLEIPSVSLAGVKLYNRAGFTLSGGKEYVVVSPTGLAAGASVQVQLDWLNPNMAAFTYTHRVLAGGLP